jgi:CheY-like chemotaxis protein
VQAALKNHTLVPSAQIPVEKKTSVLSVDFAIANPLEIHLAEDNLINQKLATRVLNKLGYSIDIAENGKIVIDMLGEKNYDIILMDVQMPEMDGLEASKYIRQANMKQPVIIAMTANAMPEDREACLQAGMNDYISKPINLEILVEKLKENYNMKLEKLRKIGEMS